MNENINLIKILENCPEGFTLYSTIYGNVTVSKIGNNIIEFIYFYKTSYGTFRNTAYVNLKGNPSNTYSGECTLFPSKEQRDWSKFTAPWYKNNKDKFDPKMLQPFDKVLIRDKYGSWRCNFFSHLTNSTKFPYATGAGACYAYCIPYNDDTKHLVGTTEEVPEYYKYWKDKVMDKSVLYSLLEKYINNTNKNLIIRDIKSAFTDRDIRILLEEANYLPSY